MLLSSFSSTHDRRIKAGNSKQDAVEPFSLSSSNPEISYLLSAAIVSKKFAKMLLQDPEIALEKGYQGRKFNVSAKEREVIMAIRAATLQEFAAGLIGQFSMQATLDIGSV